MAPADASLDHEDPFVAEGLIPASVDEHTLLLLVWAPDRPAYSEEELDRLQLEHLRFRKARRDAGLIAAYGPLRDQTEERIRGVSIWSLPLEDALALARTDPMVQAGWFAVEGGTWNVATGDARFGDDAGVGQPVDSGVARSSMG